MSNFIRTILLMQEKLFQIELLEALKLTFKNTLGRFRYMMCMATNVAVQGRPQRVVKLKVSVVYFIKISNILEYIRFFYLEKLSLKVGF